MALFDVKNALLEMAVKTLFKALLSQSVDKIEASATNWFTPAPKVHEELCRMAKVTDPKQKEALREKSRAAGRAYGSYLGAIARAGVKEDE